MFNLNNIEFYLELKGLETENATQYCGLLQLIVTDAEKILQYIRNQFPTFPDHDLQHSFRILKYIYSILSKDEIASFSATEIFCLIMAALFHDTGMALIESADADKLRENHHYECDVVIDKYFKEKLSFLPSADRIKKAVVFACNAHGRLIDDLYKDSAFDTVDSINFDMVRYSVLAVLMRIGDLMDMDNMRSHPFIMSLFKNSYKNDALNHNERHQNVQRYSHTNEKIDVEVTATNVEQHKIWSSWFTYLNDDILRANTYLTGFHLPLLNYKITKADGAKYDVQELRFEIDEKGGIWNIISQSIYTNKLDFVRELLQNAIDASLSSIYLNKSIELQCKSPRSWDSQKHIKNIVVGYSQSTNRLYVTDYGIGMSESDLQYFLFRISSSGSNKTNDRDFDFPAIAKFGIGFISCLVNANSIKIYTRKQGEPTLQTVSLESNSTLAFLETLESSEFAGTAIILDLKNSYTYHEIENYIVSTFRYASVGIDCINIDDVLSLKDVLNVGHIVSEFHQKPYMLGECCKKIIEIYNTTIAPLARKYHNLIKLRDDIAELMIWLDDNKEHDDEYPDKFKYKDYKNNISKISHYINSNSLDVPLPEMIKNISQKELFNSLELITELKSYHQNLKEIITDMSDTIPEVTNIGTNIYNPEIFPLLNEKYMVVLMDDNMETTDIMYTNTPPDLSDKNGIILLNQSYTDSKSGYEYCCVNGFMFYKGEICNSIAKFIRQKSIYTINSYKSAYTFGTNHKYDELWDYVDEEYTDDPDNDYYQFSDDPEEFDNIFEPVYDVIHISNNKFVFTENVDKSQYAPIDSFEEYLVLLHIKDRIDAGNSVDFETITCHTDSQFYQDGIKIPFDLESLIPFGFFRIVCNCTADSRTVLNVTRHNASEIPNDISSWLNSTGINIQKNIMQGIKDMIAELNLTADFKSLKFQEHQGLMSDLCKDSIRQFI